MCPQRKRQLDFAEKLCWLLGVVFFLITIMNAADNMSAMVILLKSYAPGDMVASQRGSKSAAAAGDSATAADVNGPIVTPANAASIGGGAASAGQEQQGPPAGANHHAHAHALH